MEEPKKPDPLAWSDDFLMSREQACAYAFALGIKIAVNTLAKRAVAGGGPPMTYFGRRPYYKVREFRQWLVDRQRPAGSTSDNRSGSARRPRKSG